MERMKKMMENMGEEERVRMMERCFEFMKGKETGTECCPEMMETFFTRMKDCFEGMGEKEKSEGSEKKGKPGCC